MKKVAIAIALMLVASSVFAGTPIQQTISTNSIKLLPFRSGKVGYLPQWLPTNSYSQGQQVRVSGRAYMAVTNGTSGTSAPSHGSGEATDGVLTWRRISGQHREGFVICNTATNDVWVSFGFAAELEKGIQLEAGAATGLDNDSWQGPVYVIADQTGSVVTAVDYP